MQWALFMLPLPGQLDNVKLLFNMLADVGLPQERCKPEGELISSGRGHVMSLLLAEIVYKDLKSTLRVLYSIFGKYKSRFQQQPQATAPTLQASASDV